MPICVCLCNCVTLHITLQPPQGEVTGGGGAIILHVSIKCYIDCEYFSSEIALR